MVLNFIYTLHTVIIIIDNIKYIYIRVCPMLWTECLCPAKIKIKIPKPQCVTFIIRIEGGYGINKGKKKRLYYLQRKGCICLRYYLYIPLRKTAFK